MSEYKQVIILDESLPTGILTNAVAALCVSLGKKHPELVGYDMEDAQGHKRHAITNVAIPVLKGGKTLKPLREALKAHEDELTVVDLISATSTTATYDEYAHALKETPLDQLEYYGLLIYGRKKLVNKYTGSLSLLR